MTSTDESKGRHHGSGRSKNKLKIMIKELGVETNNFDGTISCVDKNFNVA